MKDEFFVDNMVMYIEGKKIVKNFNFDLIINGLKNLKERICVTYFTIIFIYIYIYIYIYSFLLYR